MHIRDRRNGVCFVGDAWVSRFPFWTGWRVKTSGVDSGGTEHWLVWWRRNVKRFRGRFAFKAHRLWYHSTLGSREIKNKKKVAKGVGQWCIQGVGCRVQD